MIELTSDQVDLVSGGMDFCGLRSSYNVSFSDQTGVVITSGDAQMSIALDNISRAFTETLWNCPGKFDLGALFNDIYMAVDAYIRG